MARFSPFRLCQALCSCHDFLWHPTPKTSQSTRIPCCRLIQEKHLFCLSWKLFFVYFIVILKFVTWCGNIFIFSICAFSCFGWRWGGISKSAYLSLWLTRSLLMGFILHIFIILFTTGSLLWSGWMLLFIQNRCTLSDSYWDSLLYVKEISTKLAVAWHSYISQFAKDNYPLVPTIPC